MKVICQCGACSFPLKDKRPQALYHCHCVECRRQSASAFSTSAKFPASSFFPLPPEIMANMSCYNRPTDSGGSKDCYFCKKCGVRLFHLARNKDGSLKDTVSVKGGCIEGLNWKDAQHIYCKTAVVPISGIAKSWEEEPEKSKEYKGVMKFMPRL